MLFQRTISKLFKEEKSADEKYSHLRLVNPQAEPQEVKVINEYSKEEPVVLSDAEVARNWLMTLLKVHEARFKSEKCLFGTISFSVPVNECKPEIVEQIMAANNIRLLRKTSWYNLRTKELQEVRFTFDTPAEGIVYMF